MQLKQKVYEACIHLTDEKVKHFQNTLYELNRDTENDSKSSAGDKHETARAMMQLEQEKISRQLDEVLLQKASLQKIDIKSKSGHIQNGSLIKSNHGYLFLSVALGKMRVADIPVMALSPQSPLGMKLMGLTENSSVKINSTDYIIEELF
jgi:hypothetical protein